MAKAPADGYTLVNSPHHAINIALYKSTHYQEKDFAAVCRVATGADRPGGEQQLSRSTTCASSSTYARQNPGKLFNASAGFGSAPHLASVLFETVAGVKLTSVQFKGGGPAAQSLLAGDTQMMFATSPTVMGFIRAGRMKPLTHLHAPCLARDSGHPGRRGGRPAWLPLHFLVRPLCAGRHAAAGRAPAAPGGAAKGLAKPEAEGKNCSAGNGRHAIGFAAKHSRPRCAPRRPMWRGLIRESGAKIE